MITTESARTPLYFLDDQLPGCGLPTDWEINHSLFGEPPSPARQPETAAKVRIWLSGTIVLEALESPMQGQPFANWARSRLTEQVSFGDEPPEGYTGVRYVTRKAIPDTEW